MAIRMKYIVQHITINTDGAAEYEPALTVYWADDEDNEGLVKLDFATYTSIEAEWADGQGTTFTAIDAAMDAYLTANGAETQDDQTSSEIGTGRGVYTFT